MLDLSKFGTKGQELQMLIMADSDSVDHHAKTTSTFFLKYATWKMGTTMQILSCENKEGDLQFYLRHPGNEANAQ